MKHGVKIKPQDWLIAIIFDCLEVYKTPDGGVIYPNYRLQWYQRHRNQPGLGALPD
jgi:hypothetical protein